MRKLIGFLFTCIFIVGLAFILLVSKVNKDFTSKDNNALGTNKPGVTDNIDNNKSNIPDNNTDTNNNGANNKVDNSANDSILLSLNDSNYVVDIDKDTNEVTVGEVTDDSSVTSDKYVNIDYQEVAPIIESLGSIEEYSLGDYLNLYNQVKPYIETNISFSDALKLAKDFKSLIPADIGQLIN